MAFLSSFKASSVLRAVSRYLLFVLFLAPGRMAVFIRNGLIALLLLMLVALPATAGEIDPDLIGTWKLQWVGPAIYWQVRADGRYRSFGVGARPNEHWGSMTAYQGQFTSNSPFGEDGGSYSVNGEVLTTTGKLGTGSWEAVWRPGGQGSTSDCTLIDSAPVESALGTYVRGRSFPSRCVFSSTIAGSGEVSIGIRTPDALPAFKHFETAHRLKKDKIIDISGVGDRAFIEGHTITVLKGPLIFKVSIILHPAAPDTDTADLIKLAQAVAQRL
ncbi:MAG: hypothetical protein MRK02_04305 [Candidatus Scalindua sp.]|nr:hypothetical protein [Candidatus Scalindua sp.]